MKEIVLVGEQKIKKGSRSVLWQTECTLAALIFTLTAKLNQLDRSTNLVLNSYIPHTGLSAVHSLPPTTLFSLLVFCT